MSVDQLLQQQVISASRRSEALGEVAGSITLIRGEAAQNVGAATLPEVLRLAPNLFVAQASAYDWAVGARGFTRSNSRVDKMLVLIDGRTVYSPLFSGVFWDIQDVFIPDLDRVEVMSGPAGVAWGANAVNGVINITTKPARETEGWFGYAGAGNELQSSIGLRYGGRIADDVWQRAYVKRMEFDDTLAADGRSSGRDAWDFTQAGFRVDGGDDLSETEWTVQGDGYTGDYKNAQALPAHNEGANVLARWTRHYANESSLVLRVYHDYTLRELKTSIAEHLRTTDFELQHHLPLGDRHDLLWGASYRHMNESVRNESPSFAFLPADLRFHLGGVFVQDEMRLFDDRLRVTSGVRLEHNSFSDWEAQPDLRLAYVIDDDHTVWLETSRATRTPSRIDTDFYAPADPPYLVEGGPDFTSETLYAVEVGWRGLLREGLALTLSAYHHDFRRLRSIEPGDPIVIANGLDGSSRGIEAFLDWEVARPWRLRLGYFVLDQDTRRRAGGADLEGGLGEASNPSYQVQLRNAFTLSDELILWLALRSVGEVPAYSGGVSVGAVPAYTELDATVSWSIRADLDVVIAGRNLLDRSHPEIGDALTRREIERSVHASIRWRF